MPVSKRLRYEVLRRDDYACRYCGAKAPDVALTVDHVVPEALGGQGDPGNLVTACADCNAGKSSMAPDQPIVGNVADDALRWAAAMEQAAEIQGGTDHQLASFTESLDEVWSEWTREESGKPIDRPDDWKHSARNLFTAGLTTEELPELVETAMTAPRVPNTRTWRYFCGCCWNRVKERQEIARSLIEAEGE